MLKKTIYILDSDEETCEELAGILRNEGYEVDFFFTPGEMSMALHDKPPDLIILELVLKNASGMEVCRQLKGSSITSQIPIIILSTLSSEVDKVLGLEMGADDYVTKPYFVRELIARIKVQFRKRVANVFANPEVLKCRDIVLYTDKYEVYRNDEKIYLANKEFDILKLLMLNKGKALTREYIASHVWGYDYDGATRMIDVHIRMIRRELSDVCEEYIETVRGVGYKLKV